MDTVALVVWVAIGIPALVILWLIWRVLEVRRNVEELVHRFETMEMEILRLKRSSSPISPPAAAPEPKTEVVLPRAPVAPQMTPEISIVEKAPPPVFVPPAPRRFVLAPATPPAVAPTPTPAKPVGDWEQFMGIKGLAWIGGFTFFLGVVFAIQYAFAHHFIPPWVQAALGFLAGLGVLAGGVVMSRRNYPALSQTLCATGVLILYSMTFACRSYYHFAFFGAVPAFLLMALITAAAFTLAVQLDAMVVAILGMLGGLLTPILLSTGQDNPRVLFGYIAILDAGLIFVALRRRWLFLTGLAALGTAMMQVGWADKFFVAGKYFEGNKILTALGILLLFNGLYLAASLWAKSREPVEKLALGIQQWLFGSTLGLVTVALAFIGWFLSFQPLAQRPWLMFGFVILLDLIVQVLALADETLAAAQPAAGLAIFALLGYWTNQWLTPALLAPALAFYFIFALIHGVLPPFLQRRRKRGQTAAARAIHLFPLLSLMLVLIPIFKLSEISFVVWPFILLVDVLAIALGALTATVLPVLAVLLLTLTATGALICKIPSDMSGLPESLYLLGAFAVFFVTATLWLSRRFKLNAQKEGSQSADAEEVAQILPACSVVLPFILLMMATMRLPLVNPSPIFGMALLLVILLLGVARLLTLEWLPAVGLGCVTALECAWHFNYFNPANPHVPVNVALAWYLVFFAIFAVFPFLSTRRFAGQTGPWAAAAMAGPLQFFLVHRLMAAAYPNSFMGLLPAAFAVPELLSLAVVLKKIPAEQKPRLTQLAWFAGVALFFITLIFPIQFKHQWITLGWALEGAALLWLFHRVPHSGLRLTGLGLLGAAFVRLALNPAVLSYHPRSAMPILNWYLYAYGMVTVALFVGARLLAPPRNMVGQTNAPPILAAFGMALAFFLLNIEIADYFSAPGLALTFQFTANFARDMTYSIAWALFALGLLVTGIVKKNPAARYTAVGLLGVTVLKLFLHDLARLGQLYRIGAFIGVAVIAMLASFAYQKFFSFSRKGA